MFCICTVSSACCPTTARVTPLLIPHRAGCRQLTAARADERRTGPSIGTSAQRHHPTALHTRLSVNLHTGHPLFPAPSLKHDVASPSLNIDSFPSYCHWLDVEWKNNNTERTGNNTTQIIGFRARHFSGINVLFDLITPYLHQQDDIIHPPPSPPPSGDQYFPSLYHQLTTVSSPRPPIGPFPSTS